MGLRFVQRKSHLPAKSRNSQFLLSGIPLISAKSLDLRQNLSMWKISYALENLWQRFDFIWGMIWCQNPSYFGQNSTRPVLFYRIPPCFRLIFDQKRTDLMIKNWTKLISYQCYCFYTTWGFICGTIHGQNFRNQLRNRRCISEFQSSQKNQDDCVEIFVQILL